MIHRPLFFLLASLSAFAPLAIDLYLPSLASIGADLQASPGRVQQTVTVFLAGFALGMLFYGPLSDRFGRRRMIFAGTSVFVLASVACMLAQNIEQLLVFRLVQAFGGGAAAVIARAIVRDLFAEHEAAKVMAMISLVTALAPMAAPLLGAYILELGSWRHEFLALALFGLCSTIGAYWLLPETLSRQRSQASIRHAFHGYIKVLKHREARLLILAGSGQFAAMFAYITGTPFVYTQFFGLGEKTYGLLFGANIVSLMLFGWVSSRLVMRTGTTRLVQWGALTGLGGALLVLAGSWSGTAEVANLALLIAGFALCVGSLGFVSPNASAQLLHQHANNAGAASALFGSLQFGLGGMASGLVSLMDNSNAQSMSAVVLVFAALSTWASRRLIR